MIILGISPLDKDATVAIVRDGKVLFAAAEERFSRIKQHAGFPTEALQAALSATGIEPEQIDQVAYPFLEWTRETELMSAAFATEKEVRKRSLVPPPGKALAQAARRVPTRTQPIHGLPTPNKRMEKGLLRSLMYRLLGASPLSGRVADHLSRRWLEKASADHRHWQSELLAGLDTAGIRAPLKRSEHHLSHAANAYLTSGFERALVVTLDGYGSGLAGSVSLGEGGKLERLKDLHFPYSLGSFYEMVTSSLGFHPDRHAGKIVGLAAYGDPDVLTDALMERFDLADGDIRMHENLNIFYSRHLAGKFPMIDVSAAWQTALEIAACAVISYWRKQTGTDAVVLSGGVAANVKLNQRIHEIEGVERIFIYPNMGDGGCGTGLALLRSWPGGVAAPIESAYLGPEYSRAELEEALRANGLGWTEPEEMAKEVARRLVAGEVIGRFAGRMEYGPRALGNRSILYHAREPEVNHWLNQRLGRTEFMPFAPVTLYEARDRCYLGMEGAELAAQFMTITFDCTDWMKENCPAAVHVDGTARPQLIRRETNPDYYDILVEYERLSGVPCLINTSFNMHEEPIVCSPTDALRAFLRGKIETLVIGPFLVENPDREQRENRP